MSFGKIRLELDSMQARGIGRDEARSMLIVAFARDVLDRIKIDPLRQTVEQEVAKRLTRG